MTPDERAKVFKALSDPRRVAIVERLAKGAQCGTELAESLGISASLLSHHWEVLVQAGILHKERHGQLRVCSLNCERLAEALALGGRPLDPAEPSHKPAKPSVKERAARRRKNGKARSGE